MARLVRPMPAISASSEPRAASAPPTRTTGATAAGTGGVHGRGQRGDGGWRAGRGRRPAARRPDDQVDGDGDEQGDGDGAGNGALRVANLLTHGGDAGVSGEGEEQQAGGLEDAVGAAAAEGGPAAQVRRAGLAARRAIADHHDGQRGQARGHQDAGQQRGLGHAPVVERGQTHHRGYRRRALRPPRPRYRVGGEREGDRRARGGLADHEAPAGGESPPVPEPFPPVDVGAAGGRIDRRQLCGGHRVAVGDDRRDQQPDEQAGAGRAGRGAERGEHAGSDHRPEPDDHGVAGAQPPRRCPAVDAFERRPSSPL